MTVRRIGTAAAVVLMASATVALAQTGAPKKPLGKLTCEEFLAVDETFKPKVVYWAVAYGKGRRAEAAVVDIEGTEKLIPVIIVLITPDLPRLTGAHHQKVLIVKRGETLVAYCGGIDINANRLNIVNADVGQPQHDTHCRIVGPSAWDLLQTFIKRWRHHPDSAKIDSGPKGGLRGAREPVPRPITDPARISRSKLRTTGWLRS